MRNLTKHIFSTTGLLLGVALLVAVNMYAGSMLKHLRLDLTEGQIYTLSDGTRKLLSEIEEPLTLRLFLSRKAATRLPGVASYTNRVSELLEEYQRQSNGKITLVEIDPPSFSEEEDRAVGYGLRGIPLEDGETTFYFGLVGTNSTDGEEVLPYMSASREQFLEYDLSRLIYSLANPKQPKVGLLSSLPINGAPPQAMMQGMNMPPWIVMEQANQLFDIVPLDTSVSTIPQDIDVLMLVHPKSLSDGLRYAIDQFVMRGGRVVAYVDPLSEADQGPGPGAMGMQPMMTKSSNPADLLASWGVKMDSTRVVADRRNAIRVQMPQNGRFVVIDYPVWISVTEDLINDTDVVTSQLGTLTFASPGHLEAIEGAGTKVEPLVRSSIESALFDAQTVSNTMNPEELNRSYELANQEMVLAVRASGKAKSAFPDGPPKAADGSSDGADASSKEAPAEPRAEHLAESKSDINVIVVADTDLLTDRLWVQVQELLGTRLAVPSAGNGSFALNALDNLVGGGDLIQVRSRGSFLRPFDKVNDLRSEAEEAFREKEKALIARLEETEQRLQELEGQKQSEDALVLNDAQKEALIAFRQERLTLRKGLRDVRRELRENIEELEAKVKFVNIGLVPILIGFGGLVVGFMQMRRRARAMNPAAA